ncbi:type IV secretion system protein VirB8 [Pseudoxanthomonas sp. GM95]|nr:type IV secretion system protein VirB8 [Pseudoxanthomonas sp. GM95]
MISRKKEETPKVKAAIQKAVNYELTIADMAKRSEKRAWQVATGAIVLSLVLAGGYFMLLPLKERTPFLVMADPYTGNVQASRLVSDVLDKTITANEAINRANVERYVMARESYDPDLHGTPLGGWRQTHVTSAPDVAAAYRLQVSKNNPSSPLSQFGRLASVRVRILSTVLVRTPDGKGFRGATVRFQRLKYDKKNGATIPIDNKLATIDYGYKSNLRFEDQDRVLNPLGFQVTTYRVDADAASLPIVETMVAPPDGGTAQVSPPQAEAADPAALPSDSVVVPPQPSTIEPNGVNSQ